MNRFLKSTVETLHCNVSTALILLMLCCFHAPAFAALNDGLVAYWSFDDCTANDKSGKGNNGTKYGTQCVQGQIGKALDFNGTTDYIEIPDNTSLDVSNTFTISVWFNGKSLGNLSNQRPFRLIDKVTAGYSNGYMLDVWAGGFRLAAGNSGIVANTNVSENTFHHAVGIFSQGIALIYLDGKLITSGNTVETSTPINNLPIRIGASQGIGATSTDDFNGLIDEARIYNRALTAAEVTALYQQGTTPTITSITPTVAVLNQPTTFTVTGTNLTAGMGFTVSDCDTFSEITSTSKTQRKFTCTPRGTAGQKTGIIKTKPLGTRLYNFDVKILPSATPPIIVEVIPKTAVLNVATEFTVYGGNLKDNLGFTIADCDASNTEVLAKKTAISRTFICTPRGTAGRKVGIVKNAPRELSLHYFDVYVKNAATDAVPAPAVGNNIVYNSDVKIVNVSQLRGITQTRVVFSPQMKTAISSWVAGKTMFKIGDIIRTVRAILPANANGTIPIDTSIPQQGDFLSSLNVSAVDVPLTSGNLAGGISENTTPSLRVQARSSKRVARTTANKIVTNETDDVFEFVFTDHVLYDADGDYKNTTLDQLIVNGSLTIEIPKLTFTYTSAYFPTPTATANASFKASETFDLTYSSQEISFRANKSFLLGTFIVPVPASGGTVYGRLALFLVFDATGKAQLTAHFIQNVTVDLGYTAKLNGLNLYFPPARNNTSYIAPAFDKVEVTGTLSAKINLNAALALIAFNYDLSGINAIAGPSMAIKASVTNGVPCFNFLVNIGATASAYLMLPEVTVPPGYFGWLATEAKMVKRTKLLFDKNLSSAPYALNGCVL